LSNFNSYNETYLEKLVSQPITKTDKEWHEQSIVRVSKRRKKLVTINADGKNQYEKPN
jgi:hypothetical protein